MNKDEAVQHFVTILINGVLNPCSSQVEESWKSGMPKRLYGEISQWYLGLSEDDQRIVKAISDDAMQFVLFRLLSVLDGVAGFSNIDGNVAGCALYLEMFADRDSLSEGNVQEQIRINPLNDRGPFLHDVFQSRVESNNESS